jgi:hypothetical protein
MAKTSDLASFKRLVLYYQVVGLWPKIRIIPKQINGHKQCQETPHVLLSSPLNKGVLHAKGRRKT